MNTINVRTDFNQKNQLTLITKQILTLLMIMIHKFYSRKTLITTINKLFKTMKEKLKLNKNKQINNNLKFKNFKNKYLTYNNK